MDIVEEFTSRKIGRCSTKSLSVANPRSARLWKQPTFVSVAPTASLTLCATRRSRTSCSALQTVLRNVDAPEEHDCRQRLHEHDNQEDRRPPRTISSEQIKSLGRTTRRGDKNRNL